MKHIYKYNNADPRQEFGQKSNKFNLLRLQLSEIPPSKIDFFKEPQKY